MNPAAAEVYGNAVDEDCDGSTLVRRDFVSGLATNAANDFTFPSSQVRPAPPALADAVKVEPQNALVWKPTPTWGTGEVFVHLGVSELGQGSSCKLKVRTGTSSWEQTVVDGENTGHFPGVLPGTVLDEVRVYCTSGSALVDWFTLQNGVAGIAPIQDLALADWESMYTPGRQQGPTFARASADGEYMFLGTQAGFVWSDDLESWHMANGTRADLAYPGLLYFQDVLGVDVGGALPRIWAIIGGDRKSVV